MRGHRSERSIDERRAKRLAASATAAASTLALVASLGLPATAAAKTRGGSTHRISLHAAKASSQAHHAHPFHLADLTAVSTQAEFPVTSVSALSAARPHERLTPTASARGPPVAISRP